MRKTMSTCDKSFTRSGNSKVSSLKFKIHTDIDLSHFQKKTKKKTPSDLIGINTAFITVFAEFAEWASARRYLSVLSYREWE